MWNQLTRAQNRRRQQNRRYDEDEDRREKTPEFEDKLKDATTLYVGNLYVAQSQRETVQY